MYPYRFLSCMGAVCAAAGSWSFTLTQSFYFGHSIHYENAYGSEDLLDISKVGTDDPVLAAFANIVHTRYGRSSDVVTIGQELTGDWTIDSYFPAAGYSTDPDLHFKAYGSSIRSRINTTENIGAVRFVWLSDARTPASIGVDGASYPWALTHFWLYPDSSEPGCRNGTDEAGPYSYRENLNIASGRDLDFVGSYEQNRWLLLYEESVGTDGVTVLSFRGGIKYGESVVAGPVPEPATIAGLVAGLAVFASRRRARRVSRGR